MMSLGVARELTRSIYRSDAGRHAIHVWCEQRLEAAGATGRDFDTSLGSTRVTTIGRGPDVILLPGTNFSTASSLKLLALVGREHRAIGVDLPGQPGLSAGERPRDRNAYGSWLRELVQALALEPPVVVGHSFGALAALLAARGDPSIRALVLVSPGGLIRLRVRPAVLATTILPGNRALDGLTAVKQRASPRQLFHRVELSQRWLVGDRATELVSRSRLKLTELLGRGARAQGECGRVPAVDSRREQGFPTLALPGFADAGGSFQGPPSGSVRDVRCRGVARNTFDRTLPRVRLSL